MVQETISINALGDAADGTYTLQAYLTVSADEPEAAHQVETLASIKFSIEEGVLLRTFTSHGTTNDGSDGTVPKGDFDNSGTIDFGDFLNFAAAFGKTSTSLDFNPIFDLDGDGIIGFGDFLTLASGFNP